MGRSKKPNAVFSTPALPALMAPYSRIRPDASMSQETRCLTIGDVVDFIVIDEDLDSDVSMIDPSLWISQEVELTGGGSRKIDSTALNWQCADKVLRPDQMIQ